MGQWENLVKEWREKKTPEAARAVQEAYVRHVRAIDEHKMTPEKINKILRERGKARAKTVEW